MHKMTTRIWRFFAKLWKLSVHVTFMILRSYIQSKDCQYNRRSHKSGHFLSQNNKVT